MSNDSLKKAAAQAAIDLIEPDMIIGVGSGSTVNCFIELLPSIKGKIEGAVASSLETKKRLEAAGIRILDLNNVGDIPLYIDGADEVNEHKQMIKGGGGALTGEKIVANAAQKFICIADASKRVDVLGKFPVALEVIPMARSLVGRKIVKFGGEPEYRRGFVSDYGNWILDVYSLNLTDPVQMELTLTNLPGVVTCGIFANRPADQVILATTDGIHLY